MTLEIKAATDLGMKRAQNEDSHGIWVSEDPAVRQRLGVLVVVADGMGGSRAGEVASRLTVETVLQVYREGQGSDLLDDLYRAVESANQVVHRESVSRPEMNGMGTTCTAMVVRDADVFLAHVGDSRAYLMENGHLRQLSQDHSLVAQLVRDGQLTPEQARSDPRRNVVTRSIGVSAHVEIDAQRFEALMRDGGTLLMCSDGLHGLIPDPELGALASEADLAHACRQAIAMANSRGGPDNITVVMARKGAGEPHQVSASEVEVEPRYRADPHAAERDPGVERTQISMPAMRRPTPAPRPDDDDEDDREPAGEERWVPAEVVEQRKKMTLWLVLAMVVLLLAIAAAAFVLMKINRQSSALGMNEQAAENASWQ